MEKVRKAFYIEEELLGQVDALLPQADVRSRNEFVNQALRFYIGYLTSEKIENYMLTTISSVMHATVKDSENRMARATGNATILSYDKDAPEPDPFAGE